MFLAKDSLRSGILLEILQWIVSTFSQYKRKHPIRYTQLKILLLLNFCKEKDNRISIIHPIHPQIVDSQYSEIRIFIV